MKITFLGTSHAACHLSAAAAERGFELVGIHANPALVFVSEDCPTDAHGTRDLEPIDALVLRAMATAPAWSPLVITSQVPPGFTRKYGGKFGVFHQAETLRIKDAAHRASHPEMFIVGCADTEKPLPHAYAMYLSAFDCPVLRMSYESAEFAKCAINAFLISQVETTNMLARLAEKCGADWASVREALQHDSRIGQQAYLEPGRWQDSRHLLRDFATLRGTGDAAYNEPLLSAWA